jgi:hypothetical protein
MIRELKENEVEFSIECLDEHIPVRGNAIVSGDDDYDKQVEDKILSDLQWNPWAWCCVRVIASWEDFKGDDYLGACSYKSEDDFKAGGYYEDMKAQALEDLNEEIFRNYHSIMKLYND